MDVGLEEVETGWLSCLREREMRYCADYLCIGMGTGMSKGVGHPLRAFWVCPMHEYMAPSVWPDFIAHYKMPTVLLDSVRSSHIPFSTLHHLREVSTSIL